METVEVEYDTLRNISEPTAIVFDFGDACVLVDDTLYQFAPTASRLDIVYLFVSTRDYNIDLNTVIDLMNVQNFETYSYEFENDILCYYYDDNVLVMKSIYNDKVGKYYSPTNELIAKVGNNQIKLYKNLDDCFSNLKL